MQSTALNSGAAKSYTPSVTITDGTTAYTSAAISATWTARPAPTATALVAHQATEGVVDNVPIAYTCPSSNCKLTLANAFPGLGLNTTANASGDKSTASSIALTAASGTVYITGTVQSTAVAGSATSATYSTNLTLTDNVSFTSASSATWTAYAQPAITGLAALTAKRGQVSYQQLTYSCPTQTCLLSLTAPSWVVLSYDGNTTFRSTTLTAASGTIFVGGQPGSSDSSGSVSLTLTDGAGYAATTAAYTWTVTN